MRRALPTVAIVVAAVIALDARAEDGASTAPEARPATDATAPPKAEPKEESPSGYLNLFATLGFGGGFRFNNPYRLATQLGADAASVSLSPGFVDFSGNMTFGLPTNVQHGGSVHAGAALGGVPQAYMNVSYILDYHRHAAWMFHARIGPTILLSPDINVGGELASGFSWLFTGALGLTSELAFDLFYGAGTLERTYSVVPIVSAQLGVIVDFEVLP